MNSQQQDGETTESVNDVGIEFLAGSASTHPSAETELLPPKRTFAASREEIHMMQKHRVSLPGSVTNLEPENAVLATKTAGKSNLSTGSNSKGTTGKEKESLQQPRISTSQEMLQKKSGSREKVGSHEKLTRECSSSNNSDSRPQGTGAKSISKGLQGSEVIQSSIPEHKLESASSSTNEKAEIQATAARQAKGKLEQKKMNHLQPTMGLKVAASTASIPQSSKESKSNPLNINRTRSNTDVSAMNQSKATTAKNPYHAKVKGRLSAPEGRTNVTPRGAKPTAGHMRKGSETSTGSSNSTTMRSHTGAQGSHTHASLKRTQGAGFVKGSRSRRVSEEEGTRSPKSSMSPQNSSTSLGGGSASIRRTSSDQISSKVEGENGYS